MPVLRPVARHRLVIPTHSLGEGYYALANLDTSLPLEEMTASLEAAAASVTTGAVSRAIRDTADARAGDYIGFSGKDILVAASAREETAFALADKLGASASDVLILFSGADAPADEAARLKARLEKAYPMTEVILHEGGQPVYDYILILC
jgi:dihydroxyacetone kinase-like predicted kinase